MHLKSEPIAPPVGETARDITGSLDLNLWVKLVSYTGCIKKTWNYDYIKWDVAVMLHEIREFMKVSGTEGVKNDLNNKPHEPLRIHVTPDFRLAVCC